MHIAVGCDHAGLALKQEILRWLQDRGHQVEDFGCFGAVSADYPDVAHRVAEGVAEGGFDHGVLVCDTGIGMSITANKVPGIRAALCHDAFTARRSREHNDANILCLGAGVVTTAQAVGILEAYLDGAFAGGRHARRIAKIRQIEERPQG